MSQLTRRPRILLADDDPAVTAAISCLLSPSCDVVGFAMDCASVLLGAEQLQPDVVLLDFSLPGNLSPLDLCRRIKASAPQMHVIAFTGNDDEELRQLVHEAGASAFVWKLDAATQLLRTIHAVIERNGAA